MRFTTRGAMACVSLLLVAPGCQLAGPSFPLVAHEPGVPAARCFETFAEALAADAMEGRGLGTEGLARAAAAIEARMRAIGLAAPAEAASGYRQAFAVQTGVALGARSRLEALGEALPLQRAWTPLGFSGQGAFEGALVFAGYGIRAEELGYDDYAGVDVRGRVVLAMRFEPREDDPESPFEGRRPSRYSDLRAKAIVAREQGAAALVFVAPDDPESPADTLPILRVDGPLSDVGLPVMQVTRATADAWLAGAGRDLAALRAAIDGDLAPLSFVTELRVAGRVDLEARVETVENVVGVLPGRGALAAEAVVVGAHYDHLGYGGAGSRAPGVRAIHNGADDNASGVAAMLCAVEAIAAEGTPEAGPFRTLVVVAFTAEEVGLGGSSWYVDHPVFPLADSVAMLNLDMVGRVREGGISALGSDTAPEWAGWLSGAAAEAGLDVRLGGDGYGPSDHTPFYTRGMPVVHFFSGTHDAYHTPDDDFEGLDVEGGGRVVKLVAGALGRVRRAPVKPTLVESEQGAPLVGDARGYGSYLGTVPDYSHAGGADGGVLLAGVRGGGPADRAGLRKGDRIVAMGGIEVRNLYDMVFVLRDNRPGDTIQIRVLRGDTALELAATLGRRPSGPPSGEHGASGGQADSASGHGAAEATHD